MMDSCGVGAAPDAADYGDEGSNTLGNVDWDAIGERYFDVILESLEQRHLPGLRSRLVTRRHVTPRR